MGSLEKVVSDGFASMERRLTVQNCSLDALQLDKARREGMLDLVKIVGVVCATILGVVAVASKLMGWV
jgi:hypothetical protein